MLGQLTISTPPEGKLGPAMRALNPRQRLFVVALFEQGKRSYVEAARAAGYQGNPNVLRVQAHHLAHHPKVIEGIREEGQRRMDVMGAMSVEKLGHILENSMDDKVTLKAIEMVMNRVGFHAKTEHINRNTSPLDDVEKIERITKLCGMLGVDPKVMLGRMAPGVIPEKQEPEVIEGEFEEVQPSNEGLEDLL